MSQDGTSTTVGSPGRLAKTINSLSENDSCIDNKHMFEIVEDDEDSQIAINLN